MDGDDDVAGLPLGVLRQYAETTAYNDQHGIAAPVRTCRHGEYEPSGDCASSKHTHQTGGDFRLEKFPYPRRRECGGAAWTGCGRSHAVMLRQIGQHCEHVVERPVQRIAERHVNKAQEPKPSPMPIPRSDTASDNSGGTVCRRQSLPMGREFRLEMPAWLAVSGGEELSNSGRAAAGPRGQPVHAFVESERQDREPSGSSHRDVSGRVLLEVAAGYSKTARRPETSRKRGRHMLWPRPDSALPQGYLVKSSMWRRARIDGANASAVKTASPARFSKASISRITRRPQSMQTLCAELPTQPNGKHQREGAARRGG